MVQAMSDRLEAAERRRLALARRQADREEGGEAAPGPSSFNFPPPSSFPQKKHETDF